jgi:hypothetical protein
VPVVFRSPRPCRPISLPVLARLQPVLTLRHFSVTQHIIAQAALASYCTVLYLSGSCSPAKLAPSERVCIHKPSATLAMRAWTLRLLSHVSSLVVSRGHVAHFSKCFYSDSKLVIILYITVLHTCHSGDVRVIT